MATLASSRGYSPTCANDERLTALPEMQHTAVSGQDCHDRTPRLVNDAATPSTVVSGPRHCHPPAAARKAVPHRPVGALGQELVGVLLVDDACRRRPLATYDETTDRSTSVTESTVTRRSRPSTTTSPGTLRRHSVRTASGTGYPTRRPGPGQQAHAPAPGPPPRAFPRRTTSEADQASQHSTRHRKRTDRNGQPAMTVRVRLER